MCDYFNININLLIRNLIYSQFRPKIFSLLINQSFHHHQLNHFDKKYELNKRINNNVAMTGEIDLCRNVKIIGGLHAKLSGAKAAGISLALIPKENEDDLLILRHDNISPEDESFKVILIERFEDLIKYCLI